MKKVKTLANITIEKLLKEGRVTHCDTPDFYADYEKKLKQKEEDRKEAERIEKERIDNIKCPSCKSTDKKHVVKRDSNGVCGPSYSSWITDEYFVCKNCGTRYEDLTKINDDE